MPKKKAQQRQQQRRAAQGAFGRALLHRRLYEHQHQQLLQQMQCCVGGGEHQEAEEEEQQQQQPVGSCSPLTAGHTHADDSNGTACGTARAAASTSAAHGVCTPASQQQQQHGYAEALLRAQGGLLFARQHRLLDYFRGKTTPQQRRGGGAPAGQLQSVTAESRLEEYISTVLPLQQSCCLPAATRSKEDYSSSGSRPVLCRSSCAAASSPLSLAAAAGGHTGASAAAAAAAALRATSVSGLLAFPSVSSSASSPPACFSSAAGEAAREAAAEGFSGGPAAAGGAAERRRAEGRAGAAAAWEDCGAELRLPRRPVPIRLAWFPGVETPRVDDAGAATAAAADSSSSTRAGEKKAAAAARAAAAAEAAAADGEAAAARRERLKARRRNRRCVRLLLKGSLAEAATLHNICFVRDQQQRQRIKWGKQQKKADEERRRRKAAAVRWKGLEAVSAKKQAAAGSSSSSSSQLRGRRRSRGSSSSSHAVGETDLLRAVAASGSDAEDEGGCETDSSSRRSSCRGSCSSSPPSRERRRSSSTSSGRWRSESPSRSSRSSEHSAGSSRKARSSSRDSHTHRGQSSRCSSRSGSSRSSRSSKRSDGRSPSVVGERQKGGEGRGDASSGLQQQQSSSGAEAQAQPRRAARPPEQDLQQQHWRAGLWQRGGEAAAAAWDARERDAFLQWRRELAEVEDRAEGSFTLTPYERNFEVWRQLWRVAERSHLLLQVVDGRDPAFYRSRDLEQLIEELDTRKEMVLVINKADFMPAAVRAAWSRTLYEEGTPHVFISALKELCVQQQRQQQLQAQGRDQQQHHAPASAQQQEQETSNLRYPEGSRSNSSSLSTAAKGARESSSSSICGRAGGGGNDTEEGENSCDSNSGMSAVAGGPAGHPVKSGNASDNIATGCSSSSSARHSSTSNSGNEDVNSSSNRGVTPGGPEIWGSDDLLSFLLSRRQAYVEDFCDALEQQEQQQQQQRPGASSLLQQTKDRMERGDRKDSVEATVSTSAAATAAAIAGAAGASTALASPTTAVVATTMSEAAEPATRGTAAAAASLFPVSRPALVPAPPPRTRPNRPLHPSLSGAARGAADTTAAAAASFTGSHAASVTPTATSTRRKALRQTTAAPSFVVGLVGFPNVGKSSLINALFGCKKVSVSKQPGKTKHLQTLPLGDTGVVFCDCPGLVFPRSVASKHHLVANGVLPLDTMGSSYLASVQVVCDRVPPNDLLSRYGILPPQRLQQHAYPYNRQQQKALRTRNTSTVCCPGAATSAALSVGQPGRVSLALMNSRSDLLGDLRSSAAARSNFESAAALAAVTAAPVGCMGSTQQQDLWTAERRGGQPRLQAAAFLEAVAKQRKFRAGGRGGQLDLYRAAALVLADYITGRLVACRGPDGCIHAGRASSEVLEAAEMEHEQMRSADAHRQQQHRQGGAGETQPQQQQEPRAEKSLGRAQRQQNVLVDGSWSGSVSTQDQAGCYGDTAAVGECAEHEEERAKGGMQRRHEDLSASPVHRRVADSFARERAGRLEDEDETTAETEGGPGTQQYAGTVTRAPISTAAAATAKAAARHTRQDAPNVGPAATDTGRYDSLRGREAIQQAEEDMDSGDGGRCRKEELQPVQLKEGTSAAGAASDDSRSELVDGTPARSTSEATLESNGRETLCGADGEATDGESRLHAEQAGEALLREIFASAQDDTLLQLLKDGGSCLGLDGKRQGQHETVAQQEKGLTNRKRRHLQKQALKGKVLPAGRSTARKWL